MAGRTTRLLAGALGAALVAAGAAAPARAAGGGGWDIDPPPRVWVGQARVFEGDVAHQTVKMPITLSEPLDRDIFLTWHTRAGTATPGSDYREVPEDKPRRVRIRTGRVSAQLPVRVYGDLEVEEGGGSLGAKSTPQARDDGSEDPGGKPAPRGPEETFEVIVSGVDDPDVLLERPAGTVLIIDNDSDGDPDATPSQAGPSVGVGDVAVFEGPAGRRNVRVPITLSEPQGGDVLVSWETADVTAMAGEDYRPVVGRTTRIRSGKTKAFAPVAIIGDDVSEQMIEAAAVVITGAALDGEAVVVGRPVGEVLIVDDDLDTDGDHLADGIELLVYGTDPSDPDTDSDGLSDGAEVYLLGTDPRSADTDGDGWDDLSELKLGTDPTDPDSRPAAPGAPTDVFAREHPALGPDWSGSCGSSPSTAGPCRSIWSRCPSTTARRGRRSSARPTASPPTSARSSTSDASTG
jgi:hypothetical protein